MVLIVGLIGINGASVIWSDGSWTPKLALDLEGGTEIILAPQVKDGEALSAEQRDQAVSIIRQRVDASGSAEAEISTQGAENIVVAIPGKPTQEQLDRIEASSQLDFRPVLVSGIATFSTATAVPTESATAEDSAEDADAATPADGSDLAWVTPELQEEFDNFDCTAALSGDAGGAPTDEPLVTCGSDGMKYILGPVEVSGDSIDDATSGLQTNQNGTTTGVWAVNIRFNGEGTEQFKNVTSRLNSIYVADNTDPRGQFAIVLDGVVISAPTTNAVITDGRPEISGSFTEDSAKALADQLKFGALPIDFTILSTEEISATLGAGSLASGLLAAGIGLILVALYSFLQYRVLGVVTIASLAIAAVITYLLIAILSWRQDYRLSLAGITGLIVAIGVTADSFIVYFERIRDGLRDGRSLDGAIESGWKRAIRTILASDGMHLLAAVILTLLAVGSVRGFAFTLGLTTIVDVLVVSLFTHPLMVLLGKTKYFSGGHPSSGLDPIALGAVYRGRAQFRAPLESTRVSGTKKASSAKEAQRRQTIAERKAAADSAPAGQTDSKKEGNA